MAIRFHLDEHVDHEIATALRTRGIDVTTTTDAGLLQSDDEDHVAFALREKRVIFTNDQDFLRLHARGAPHAGIAFCERGSRSTKEIIRSLCVVHDSLTEDEMAGQVEYI
jgi:predicted nuclease of predicted toxin-antitoxin system